MKKSSMTCYLLVLSLICSALLSGCGSSKSASEVKPAAEEKASEAVSDTKETAEAPSEEVKAEETAAEDVTKSAEATPAEESSSDEFIMPVILHESEYRGDNRSTLFHSTYDLLSMGDFADRFPKLEEMLSEKNADLKESAKKTADEMEKEAKAYRDDTDSEVPFYEYDRYYVKRADEDVLCYLSSFESFAGGAHGMNGNGGYNYYTATGEAIPLSDVIKDMDLLKDVLIDKLNSKYPDIEWFSDLDEAIDSYIKGEYEFNWVLENQCITFFFNPYELAAYAYGSQTISIPFDDFPGLFTGKITSNTGKYVEALDFYQEVSVFDKSGTERPLQVEAEYDYDNGGYLGDYYVKTLTVNFCGINLSDDDFPAAYAYEHDMFLVHTEDGRNYLYIDCYQDNDWHSVVAYELTYDGNVNRLNETDGGFYLSSSFVKEENWKPAVFDPDKFELHTRADVLSTTGTTRYYKTGLRGYPEPFTNYYTILSDLTIKSKVPLKARFIGETEDLSVDAPEVSDKNGSVTVLPAGTGFRLWRTDNEAYVDCVVKEAGKNNVYRLIQEIDKDWNRMVDGINIDDAFEELFWAG